MRIYYRTDLNKSFNEGTHSPLMRLQVELPVQLTHGDRFRIHYVRVHRHKGIPAGLGLSLQGSHRIFQYLVALKQKKADFEKGERLRPDPLPWPSTGPASVRGAFPNQLDPKWRRENRAVTRQRPVGDVPGGSQAGGLEEAARYGRLHREVQHLLRMLLLPFGNKQ